MAVQKVERMAVPKVDSKAGTLAALTAERKVEKSVQ